MSHTERIALLRGKLQGWLDEANAATDGPWRRDPYDGLDMQIVAHGNEVIIYHKLHPRQCNARVIPNHRFIARARTITPAALKGYLALLGDAERDFVTATDFARGWVVTAQERYELACRTLDTIEAAVREMEAS